MSVRLGDLTKYRARKTRAKIWKDRLRPRSVDQKLRMETFRCSSQQAQAVREQFGNKVEEVLKAFDVPTPPLSHGIIQPGAAVGVHM